MKTKILLAGLACLSVVAVAQQQKSDQKPSNTDQQMVRESPTKTSTALRESPSKASLRESPSKASTAVRESPSKSTTQVTTGDVNGDGKADKNIGSQSSGSGAGVAVNTSHSNIKSPRDLSTGQASGKVNVQDLNVMKRTDAPAPAEPKK